MISNAHKLKKYILITMNCCNRQLLLPLEDDGLMVDNIILVYQTHSLIGYTTKEINCKSRPCHAKSLVELGRRPRSACRRSPIPRPTPPCCRHSDRLSTPPPPVISAVVATVVVIVCRRHIV